MVADSINDQPDVFMTLIDFVGGAELLAHHIDVMKMEASFSYERKFPIKCLPHACLSLSCIQVSIVALTIIILSSCVPWLKRKSDNYLCKNALEMYEVIWSSFDSLNYDNKFYFLHKSVSADMKNYTLFQIHMCCTIQHIKYTKNEKIIVKVTAHVYVLRGVITHHSPLTH